MGEKDFMEEVNDFNMILEKTISFCQSDLNLNTTGALYFIETRWNPSFIITYSDCQLIMSKKGVRAELRERYDADEENLPQPVPPVGSKIPGC